MNSLLFILAVTLHNLEEAIWLPRWSRSTDKFSKPVRSSVFLFAVSIITLLSYCTALFYFLHPENPYANRIFFGFLGSMMVNTIFPHLLASIVMKRYNPGMASGLLFIWPVGVFLFLRAFPDSSLSVQQLVVSVLLVGAGLLGLLPLLFAVGRKIMGKKRLDKTGDAEEKGKML